MCARFTIISRDKLKVVFNVTVPTNLRLVVGESVFPDDLAPVITAESNELQLFRWGLIPRWFKGGKLTRIEKDGKVRLRLDMLDGATRKLGQTFNARAETLAEKPSFRDALAKRRCLIPSASFYEPREVNGRKSLVQLSMADREPLAFAGLWETWHDPSGEDFNTFTVITTEPNMLIGQFHDRMPAILPREAQTAWLHEGRIELLRPYSVGNLISEAAASITNSVASKPSKHPKIKPAQVHSQGSLF